MLLGPCGDHVEGALEPVQHERPGLLHGERQRRVEHVGGRQSEVEPAAVVTEPGRDRVDERGDVVIRLALELRDALGRGSDARVRGSARRASAGTTPMLAHPSRAASSTSSIRPSRASSDQIRAISGRE